MPESPAPIIMTSNRSLAISIPPVRNIFARQQANIWWGVNEADASAPLGCGSRNDASDWNDEPMRGRGTRCAKPEMRCHAREGGHPVRRSPGDWTSAALEY